LLNADFVSIVMIHPSTQDTIKTIIRKETDLLKKQIDRVNAYLPPDKGKDAYREVLLSGLDNIRSRVDAAHVAFSNIEGHAEPRLPLVVSFDYSDYFQLVKLLDQLEGVRFPFFSFKSFSFQKTSTGTAECEVTGSLVTQRGDP